jgi:hypothetical protein
MAIGYDAGPIYPNDSGGEVYALPNAARTALHGADHG